ncbi:MAG: hydroxyacylglutathione hydrolase [Minicystis sp.]
MRVLPIPCLSDNYAYLVGRDGTDEVVVIDPSESGPVIGAVEREGLRLVAILNTHHHHDHVGGNAELRERFGPLPIYAHRSDRGRVPNQSVEVEEGVGFIVAGLSVRPLHVPGHTTGAVAYVIGDAVFTGDTLFVAGCGRLFEGTPAMMHESLSGKLARLPAETRVYCGHEYTVNNLRFAVHAEPGNKAAVAKLEAAKALRERGQPTVPSTIGEERETNPFLRVDVPSLRDRFPGASVVETFAAVRKAKDTFK